MSDSEVKSKDLADDHDPTEDQEFVPDDAAAQANDEAQEPDPEDVKEALEDDEVNDEKPAEADEDQQAEVEEVYDSGGDYEEDIESEVSVEDDDDLDNKEEPRGTKRDNEDEDQSAPNKKQKDSPGGSGAAEKSDTNGAEANGKVGSKHDDPRDPETQGSTERLPEVGQQVEWKALPGFVDGEVVEILREEKDVDGKSVKAREDDPRLVLKSNKSGKICVHKPEALYFK